MGMYDMDGYWDVETDDNPYDDPPEPKSRQRKPLIRGGAGKRKGKSPRQYTRNYRRTPSLGWGVTVMRDWDYAWYRLVVPQFRDKPIDVRKLWHKKVHHDRRGRHLRPPVVF